jgi:hypothetical protein
MHLPWMHLKKGTSLAFVKLFFSLIGISLGIGVWLLQAYQDHILKQDFYFYTLFLSMLFLFVFYYMKQIKKISSPPLLCYEKALLWAGLSTLSLGCHSLGVLVFLYVGQTIIVVTKPWKGFFLGVLGCAGVMCLTLSLHDLTSETMTIALSIHVPWLASAGYLMILACFLCGSQLALFSLVPSVPFLSLFHNVWTFILLSKMESEFFYSFSHEYILFGVSALSGIKSMLSLHPMGIFTSCMSYSLSFPLRARFVLICIYGIGFLGCFIGDALRQSHGKESKHVFFSTILPASPLFCMMFYSFKECIESQNFSGLLFFIGSYSALLFHTFKTYAPLWIKSILRDTPSGYEDKNKSKEISSKNEV